MNIMAMLRVKNEARWITKVISSIKPLCSQILVLDDHSTDGTTELCEGLGDPVTVFRSHFEGMNEVRDKNWLLEQTGALNPEWILMVDGDEELEESGPEKIRADIESGQSNCYTLRVVYLWDSPEQVRVDGIYGRFVRPSLFRYRPGLNFASPNNAAQFHCGNVPAQCRPTRPSGARLLHYGYMCREDRLRKYAFYNDKDPGNRSEDGYRHVVVGDVFPADAQFRWAGPLRLEPLA